MLIEDVEKLKFYKESFRVGDRLDFAEEITKYLIDRVLSHGVIDSGCRNLLHF
ncbi:DUF6990 domain-containing protein [Bartonella refiksaydamii]|uniref:DUF6990 domain-containing protein n=1 Tax=Bartonella refiksaydamii TaxID=2654951 RepID=UPI003F7259FF